MWLIKYNRKLYIVPVRIYYYKKKEVKEMKIEVVGRINTERVEISEIRADFQDVGEKLSYILCKKARQRDFYERLFDINNPPPEYHPGDTEFSTVCNGFEEFFKDYIRGLEVSSPEELQKKLSTLISEITEELEKLEEELHPRPFNIFVEKQI